MPPLPVAATRQQNERGLHILAFSNKERRISGPSIGALAPVYVSGTNENVYPFLGNGLTFAGSTAAARAGRIRKPLIIMACENEVSVAPDLVNMSDNQAEGYAQLLGYPRDNNRGHTTLDFNLTRRCWTITRQRRERSNRCKPTTFQPFSSARSLSCGTAKSFRLCSPR